MAEQLDPSPSPSPSPSPYPYPYPYPLTRRTAEQLEAFLYRASVPATSIHGDRTQREREQARPLPRPLAAPTPHSSPSPNPNHISRISPPQALHAFRKGQPPTLVATDVAVRRLRL